MTRKSAALTVAIQVYSTARLSGEGHKEALARVKVVLLALPKRLSVDDFHNVMSDITRYGDTHPLEQLKALYPTLAAQCKETNGQI